MNEGRTDGRRDEGGREGRKGQLRHQIQNGLRATCPLAQKSKRHVMTSDDCDVIIAEALNGAEEQKEVWMRMMMMMGGICLVLHSGAASFW